MEKIKYNENQSVFKVGELPDKMYLLVKGSVGIFLPTNETKKPNFIIIDDYINLIKNEKCELIKLVRAFENLDKKISPLAFIVYAVTLALKDFPLLNSSISKDLQGYYEKKFINIGNS